MVHKWLTEFRCGRINISDAERPGRPKEVTSHEMIDKIHDIVFNVHECLGMRKRSARWVPRLSTAEHEQAHVIASEQCLVIFQYNSKEFLRRYVTADVTWIHYYTPETKNQSKMWTGPRESA